VDESLSLTAAERGELEALLHGAVIGVAPKSFAYLLVKWSALVRSVEEGYPLSIYDYTNSLCARDLLEVAIANASDGLRDKLVPALDPLDKRFASATELAVLPLTPRSNPGWWWQRVPKRRDGEFAADLEVFGHIKPGG